MTLFSSKSKKSGDEAKKEILSDADFESRDDFLASVRDKNPHEDDFLQAVEEFVGSVWDICKDEHPEYLEHNLLSRIVEPERVVMFRVPWQDDEGRIRVNRGFRVQFSSTLGPYKGGIRFHPSVKLDTLKFLGFEQTFKNALTLLPLGGGKGGSDFDPKGKSDNEVMRFCQSFATELQRHVGPNTDVPAGDIGVAGREVGFMFGQYKRIRNEFSGTFTGKSLLYGGSNLRVEATGYGVVYFLREMLRQANGGSEDDDESKSDKLLEGKLVALSGSGNVSQYACEKLIQLGAKVITLSDSGGYIVDEEGIDEKKLEFVKKLKGEKRGRIKEYVDEYSNAKFYKGERPWGVKCDIAIPCATQNEVSEDDAKSLVDNGVSIVCEGANMPCEAGAIKYLQKNKVLFGPAKAANAGGVATSGLEMSQNSQRLNWTSEEVDSKLKSIMKEIHQMCVDNGSSGNDDDGNAVDYVKGANVGAFRRIAKAMLEQGCV